MPEVYPKDYYAILNSTKLRCVLLCLLGVMCSENCLFACIGCCGSSDKEEIQKDAAEELFRKTILPRIKMLRNQNPIDRGTISLLRASETVIDGKSIKMSWISKTKKENQYALTNEDFTHHRGNTEATIWISNRDYYASLVKNPNGRFSFKQPAKRADPQNISYGNLTNALKVGGAVKMEELFNKDFIQFISCNMTSEFVEFNFKCDWEHPDSGNALEIIVRFDLIEFNPILSGYTFLLPGQSNDMVSTIHETCEWTFNDHLKLFHVRRSVGERRNIKGDLELRETVETEFGALEEEFPYKQVYASYYDLPEPEIKSGTRGRWLWIASCLFLIFGICLIWYVRQSKRRM